MVIESLIRGFRAVVARARLGIAVPKLARSSGALRPGGLGSRTSAQTGWLELAYVGQAVVKPHRPVSPA